MGSQVGRFIDSYCSRCGMTMAHVVLYEVNGVVAGVKCRTCGSEHRHRGPAPVPKKEAPTVRGSGGALVNTTRQAVRPAANRQWEAKNSAAPVDAVVWEYKLSERYEKGDIILHARFGRGFVESTTIDKMDVLFREGKKLLAMNRATPS